MTRRRATVLYWVALFVWACTILWLSSLTPDELPDSAHLLWDKINHFVAFAVGGWLAARALRLARPTASVLSSVLLAAVLISAFGVLDESVQQFTPGRSGGDLYDWIADTLGALAGASLGLRLTVRQGRP